MLIGFAMKAPESEDSEAVLFDPSARICVKPGRLSFLGTPTVLMIRPESSAGTPGIEYANAGKPEGLPASQASGSICFRGIETG